MTITVSQLFPGSRKHGLKSWYWYWYRYRYWCRLMIYQHWQCQSSISAILAKLAISVPISANIIGLTSYQAPQNLIWYCWYVSESASWNHDWKKEKSFVYLSLHGFALLEISLMFHSCSMTRNSIKSSTNRIVLLVSF